MKKLSKNTKSSLTTYGMVVAAYLICELFLRTGHMTSLLKGLLVPLCSLFDPCCISESDGRYPG